MADWRRTLIASVTICLLSIAPRPTAALEKPRVNVPSGFRASLFADDDLAHDVFSMTVDAKGRVVVSAAGYVRILIDRDGDGRADSYRQFADGPRTGAQGMFFDGRDLICTGDAGLIRYRDRDGDDRADGPPETLLKIKTGGEHHVHALRKGPDGWWYVIAGNYSGFGERDINSPASPIRRPLAGVLLRLSPDFSAVEVVADGFRNAYDFAFHPQGDAFAYDSDGERDVTLPWYRPTRVFQSLPGSNAGWFSRSWKRPDYYFDMPPVTADLGRGSPTGVACYRHGRFPPPYRDAVFVLDWTFGRVVALPLKRDGSAWKCQPIEFMTSAGSYGFAPTDIAVGPEGALFVSVGGRGTRGGVFRVVPERMGDDLEPSDKLTSCLSAPQPLSSWSRARWVPLARSLGRDAVASAAADARRPERQRVRAVEILTELFGGVDGQHAKKLAAAKSPQVRARAAWALGRTNPARPDAESLAMFLRDDDPFVARFALESLLGAGKEMNWRPLLAGLRRQLGATDRFVRAAAARAVARMDDGLRQELAASIDAENAPARLAAGFGVMGRSRDVREEVARLACDVLRESKSNSSRLEAARLLQMALGDVSGNRGVAAVFDGYVSHAKIRPDTAAACLAAVANGYPAGHRTLDLELARLLAMLAPDGPKLLTRVLSRIDVESSVGDDVHHLIVAARFNCRRNPRQRAVISSTLLLLDDKISQRNLRVDNNWEPRLGELYRRLVQADPALAEAVVSARQFGRHPAHVLFANRTKGELRQRAIRQIARAAENTRDYSWTSAVVFLLGDSSDPRHMELVRRQFDDLGLRDAVLLVLSRRGEPRDRAKFVAGLDSSQYDVLSACLGALAKLSIRRDAAEPVALVHLLRRLGKQPAEYALREKAVTRLREHAGRGFGYQLGKQGHRPQPQAIDKWTAWVRGQFPQEARRRLQAGNGLEEIRAAYSQTDWDAGDAGRGRKVFGARSCARCHGARRALGPDLAGAARRFSRDDLFTAITDPSRDVSPRYQTTFLQTADGKVLSGLIIYESVDGLILRDANNQTFRIERDNIEQQGKHNRSLMPTGLLKDLKPGDLADLYAYLKGLK